MRSPFCKVLLAFLPCPCSSVNPLHGSAPSDSQTSLPSSPIRKYDLLNSLDLLYSHKATSGFSFQSTFIYKWLSWQLLLYSLDMAPRISNLLPEDSRAATQQSPSSVLLLPARLSPRKGYLPQHLLNRQFSRTFPIGCTGG